MSVDPGMSVMPPAHAPAAAPAAKERSLWSLFSGLFDHESVMKPVDVTAVPKPHDVTTWAARAVHPGAASDFTDVPGMVDSVLANADGRPIRNLSIQSHGNPGHQFMSGTYGRDSFLSKELLTDKDSQIPAAMGRLKQHLDPNGMVELGGCQVAKGEKGVEFVREMTRTLGVPVRAGVPYQRPLIPGLEGSTVTCSPAAKPDEDPTCVTESHPFLDWLWGE
jgi:hypothetical protein